MNYVMNCEKYPNAWGCPKNRTEATGFFSKFKDSACSLMGSACDWNLLPKKCCDSALKSFCKKKHDEKEINKKKLK